MIIEIIILMLEGLGMTFCFIWFIATQDFNALALMNLLGFWMLFNNTNIRKNK